MITGRKLQLKSKERQNDSANKSAVEVNAKKFFSLFDNKNDICKIAKVLAKLFQLYKLPLMAITTICEIFSFTGFLKSLLKPSLASAPTTHQFLSK